MAMNDVAESTLQKVEERTRRSTGMNILHWATFGSIAASVALFIAGKKNLAIFIGLWPPTLQALRHHHHYDR
jgi:hypothetical protein